MTGARAAPARAWPSTFNTGYKTRLSGEASARVANATQGYIFNDTQSYFLLTTSALASKEKKALPMVVQPDEEVVHNDAFESLETDKAVQAALAWLGRKDYTSLQLVTGK